MFRLEMWYFVFNPGSRVNEILRLERSCKTKYAPLPLVASIDRITVRRNGSAASSSASMVSWIRTELS